MHRVGFLIVFSSLSLSPSIAHTQPKILSSPRSDVYVGGSGAIAYFSDIEGAEYDLGFAVSGLIGTKLGPDLRAELDLSYEAADFENSSDETSLFRVSGSLYFDLDSGNGWRPYIGGGAGIVDVDVGNDEDNIELTAHAEAGFSIPLDDKLDFVPGLRIEYILLDDIDDQIITQLRAGLRLHL